MFERTQIPFVRLGYVRLTLSLSLSLSLGYVSWCARTHQSDYMDDDLQGHQNTKVVKIQNMFKNQEWYKTKSCSKTKTTKLKNNTNKVNIKRVEYTPLAEFFKS